MCDRFLKGVSARRTRAVLGCRARHVERVKRLMHTFTARPAFLTSHVDGAEESNALRRLSSEDVLDSRVSHVANQRVEAATAQVLQ